MKAASAEASAVWNAHQVVGMRRSVCVVCARNKYIMVLHRRSQVDALADRFRALQQHGVQPGQQKSPDAETEVHHHHHGLTDRVHKLHAASWHSSSYSEPHERALDLHVSTEVASERRAREEMEARLMNTIDDRLASVNAAFARDRRMRSEADERTAAEISELAAAIQAERRERAWRTEQLEERHERMVRSLRADIAREREQRERIAAETSAMIDELVNTMRAELRHERQEREHTEEAMFRVLDGERVARGSSMDVPPEE